MESVKISTKGQIVIPKYLRDALSIKPGDELIIAKSGQRLVLMLKPQDAVQALADAGRVLSLRSIRKEIKEE